MIPARRRASPRSLNSPLNVEADSIRSSKRRAIEKTIPDKAINEVIAHPHACRVLRLGGFCAARRRLALSMRRSTEVSVPASCWRASDMRGALSWI